MELGVYPSNDQRQIRLLQLCQYPGLINQALTVERHPFDYPTIELLLSQLDASGTRPGPQYGSILETLYKVRMITVDDLTMISERDLFLISGIPPGMIRAIYNKAKQMMLEVHVENKKVILEMDDMRKEQNE